MAQEIRTSLIIDLAGNLQAQGRRFIDVLRGVGHAGKEAGGKMDTGLQRAGGSVNWLINRYTALGGVLAVGAIVNQVNKAQEAFERLAGALGKPIAEIRALKGELDTIAGRHDIDIETGSLTDAAGQIAKATKDLEFIKNNAPTIARALQVAGPGQESAVAQMFIALQRQHVTAPEHVSQKVEDLFAQSKTSASAMSFEELAASGPIMGALLSSDAMEVGAVLQTAAKAAHTRGGGQGPEGARMAALAFFHELQSGHVKNKLLVNGVNLFDAQGKQRPLAALIADMAQAHVLDSQAAMDEVGFSAEAQVPMGVWADEFKRTGQIKSLGELLAAHGTSGMAEESAKFAMLPGVIERRAQETISKASAKHVGPAILDVEQGVGQLAEGHILAGITSINSAADKTIKAPARALEVLLHRNLAEMAQTRERQQHPRADQPQGKVTVEFQNPPPGMRVKKVKGDGLDLDVNTGTIMPGR